MDTILHTEPLSLTRLHATSNSAASIHPMPCQLIFRPFHRLSFPLSTVNAGSSSRRSSAFVFAASGTLTANSVSPRGGVYTVGDFMTRKEDLHVVKPTTTVGLVSDYDLLALDSISGRRTENDLFPEVDSTWKVVGDLMTPAPLVVRETTNLEDAARLLLETKYRRLPVVDVEGKLVGIITRGNVVRAALQIKREIEGKA
ncbi:CBS domain-containing protein CBSX1, chloroplastic-like isoform X3 [Gossypium australe]|uniref:CBS domain-containing protein CBSX1, chloroplastic-like isoform X3 n=1 Tax=Gossypium australe TaxID=47621 RepID=A0A5B6UKU9_9ROSI|nr:CBS domain-containing protein CBSX1, chloroplastic-like isoform X3 [Gossypium australe]